MEERITRQDLQAVRTAGLQGLCARYDVPWGRNPGRTNDERREVLWARLGGEGAETVPVDAAWWAAAQAMGSKDTQKRFEELARAERVRLAREAASGRGGNASGSGHPRTPAAIGPAGRAAGSQPKTPSAASQAGGEGQSLDAPMGDQASEFDSERGDAGSLADLAEAWQTAGKGRRGAKKPKRAAATSPMVEQTPPPRRERVERGEEARGGAAAAPMGDGRDVDQTRPSQGSTEEAFRRAAGVIAEAQACLAAVLDAGGMTPALRAYDEAPGTRVRRSARCRALRCGSRCGYAQFSAWARDRDTPVVQSRSGSRRRRETRTLG